MKQKTPDQIQLEFYRNGQAFQQWAIENGYPPVLVSKVLNGAVKLGLKAA